MNNLTCLSWSANSEKTLAKLDELLNASFNLQETENEACRYQVLDDANWHLWYAGRTLVRSGTNCFRLIEEQQETECTEPGGNLKFWWNFESPQLRETLKKTLDLRALIPVTELNYNIAWYNLLNNDDKTVIRLKTVSLLDTEHNPVFFIVTLNPLRGYQKEFQQACCLIESLSLVPEENPDLKRLMQAQGLNPPPQASKTYGIEPQQPTEEVVRKMLTHMFQEARTHEPGIIDDIDTEFLHDYRVSLRKSRSLLNLMKKSFDEQWQQQAKLKLSKLAQETNRLRDLDVFLLDQQHYTSMLPEHFAGGMDLMFEHIQKQRDKALKQVVTALTSDNYRALCNELQAMFEAPAVFAAEQSSKAVGKVALKRIQGRYHKICVIGTAIDKDTPDEHVHELRIECKKLRYLLDFFKELFDPERTTRLIAALKKLQNILGNFNDYSVQQEFLKDRLQEEKSEPVKAALNGLIAVLHQQQLAERDKVETAFAKFSSDKIAVHFQQLTCLGENN